MALRKSGRTLYLDAPDTYNDMTTRIARIDQIRLVAGAGAAAQLDIYANSVTTDDTKKIATLKAAAGGTDELNLGTESDLPTDSIAGLSAVLSGASSIAYIYLA